MRKPIINPGIINRLKMLFAIVQDGDTATRNITKGKCVIWKNTPCRAITDISAGGMLSSTNLSTDSEGYINSVESNISNLQDGLAIVANGDTHAAISSGQFVYVKNHDTLAEGLYKATAPISVDEALTSSNLTPDGSGGLNDLQSQVTSLNSNKADYDNRHPTFTLVSSLSNVSIAYNMSRIRSGVYIFSLALHVDSGSISTGEKQIGTVDIKPNDYITGVMINNGNSSIIGGFNMTSAGYLFINPSATIQTGITIRIEGVTIS